MSVEKRITDVTEKYAIMCKKANGFINAQIHPNKLAYSSLKGVNEEPTVHIVTTENISKLENPVRVFSQREIERLVFEPDKTCVQNFLDFSEWAKGQDETYLIHFDTMEQLMLGYLMSIVYSKKWDGENWVEY